VSDTVVTGTYTELPVFFETSEARLFGIVTLPPDSEPRTGVVILPGAGAPFTVNRNRLSVRLGRELARLGFGVLRCDYHGTGESTGVAEGFRLDRPFVEDVLAAAECLRTTGVDRLILVGSCFGGRSALSAAARLEGVEAVVLLATSLRDHVRGERKSAKAAATWGFGRYVVEALRPRRLRGMFSRRSRRRYAKYARAKLRAMHPGEQPQGTEVVGPGYEEAFRTLLGRRVPIVQIFGTDDSSYEEYREAAAGPLADALARTPDGVEVRTIPGKIHGFLTPPIQDAVIDAVVAWAAGSGLGSSAPERPSTDVTT
jgi:pimeloyl-ACP methyl ester carboxylesterase